MARSSARKRLSAVPVAAPMRVLVTGATNPYGEAIVRRLAADGHAVRAFGVPAGDDRFGDIDGVTSFPGWVEVGGSIEPVLAEREALVHAACLDDPGKDKRKAAIHIERGTLYTRYAAEREQVDHFIHLAPVAPGRTYSQVQANARDQVEATRGDINVRILEVDGDINATADRVAQALQDLPMLGTITGGHTNAVTP